MARPGLDEPRPPRPPAVTPSRPLPPSDANASRVPSHPEGRWREPDGGGAEDRAATGCTGLRPAPHAVAPGARPGGFMGLRAAPRAVGEGRHGAKAPATGMSRDGGHGAGRGSADPDTTAAAQVEPAPASWGSLGASPPPPPAAPAEFVTPQSPAPRPQPPPAFVVPPSLAPVGQVEAAAAAVAAEAGRQAARSLGAWESAPGERLSRGLRAPAGLIGIVTRMSSSHEQSMDAPSEIGVRGHE
mmetsp:Transcript_34346/g.110875  ORF Transcript_34346/g.110875 Transcript_34346/m.110875 type:complete len:243 (-) Transcript_34346:482-1210(-)